MANTFVKRIFTADFKTSMEIDGRRPKTTQNLVNKVVSYWGECSSPLL